MTSVTSRRLLITFFVAYCVTTLFLGQSIVRSDDQHQALKGPAFTNPLQIMDMDENWKKQRVKYDSGSEDADLVISLDQQMYPAFSSIIKEYATKNHINISVNNGTCGISSGLLSRKAVDIGGYCCPPGITDRLPGLRFHTLGISAIALIVNPVNPVSTITMDEARRIFMGELNRWSSLLMSESAKGPNLPIQPVGRLHCKLRAGHWRLILDNEDLFSPTLQEVGAIPDMIAQVTGNERAIGYETLWMIHNFKSKGHVKTLRINGHDPESSEDVISGTYPLYRVYSLTTWEGDGIANPLAQKVVDYIMQQVEHMDSKFALIPASRLREAGWKFYGDELVGEPGH